METPTSSGKVKVEYSDPFGVYQLIASDLQSRLPLRNLNWTSASRPTRSIDSLYVDIVADEKTAAVFNLKRTTSNSGASETPASPSNSGEFKRQDSQPVKRERRHQIPGLRRTPYLKVYFLRCDDSETYKATARKAVREWIKTNSAASQTGSASSQENHDAFEYMIVHVVLPDVQTGASWPTRASASVLEKLKSDFNSSSRNSPDRIIQIPATKNLQVQGVTVNPVPTGPAKDAFLQDSARAWDDLIAKMKLLILNSFDGRVKQYEEDIKEKGTQRSLPGWNFCTFFVLKEGLARGFESVGLVDDALVGYDELSLELLFAIREENKKESRLFREHTQELLIQAESALQGQDPPKSRSSYKRSSNSVLEVDSKPYRELILANNISVFDFRSYVFARQTQIMLRLASLSGKALKANSSAVDLTTSRDPVILADICWRAKEFFADIARVIRLDLRTCFRADTGARERELKARYTVTENLIASWVYKGAIDILNKTREAGLPDVEATEAEVEEEAPQASSPLDSQNLSLSPSAGEYLALDKATSQARNGLLSSGSYRSKERLSLDSARLQSAEKASLPSGASALAAERAELYLIARRALSSVGERQGWKTTWLTADDATNHGELDEVSLEETPVDKDPRGSDKVVSISESPLAGVLDPAMRAALTDKATFYNHWEELSLLAFLLFEVAKVRKSVYLITADIAAVRVRLEDYAYAAPFLRDLGPQYTTNQWHTLEVAVLDMYVFCLQKLDKPEDYIPAALQMLAKSVRMNDFITIPDGSSNPISNVNLRSIIAASDALPNHVQVGLDDFFDDIIFDQQIFHSTSSDEYGVQISFDSHSKGDFPLDQVDVRARSKILGSYVEISFSSTDLHNCIQGVNAIEIRSRKMFPGWLDVESITFTSGKIKFFKSYKGSSLTNRTLQNEATSPKLLIWPSRGACVVKAYIHNVIQLEQPRAIVFEISPNRNTIDQAMLLLKSATAGLRLHISDAEVLEGDCKITSFKRSQTIPLDTIHPNDVVKIRVPYQVEGDVRQLHIRCELHYELNGDSFIYGINHQLTNQLPLGVNVQDVFKKDALFSKFSISTSSDVPIRVLHTKLDNNDMYNVASPYMEKGSHIVFPKQPVSLVYRITKTDKAVRTVKKKLTLQIDYQCMDEQVVTRILGQMTKELDESRFGSSIPLLLAHAKTQLERSILQQDLERVGLLGQIRMPTYNEMDWEDVLTGLASDNQAQLASWLQQWHERNTTITIDERDKSVDRRIEIPVEIPSLSILHTASLTTKDRPTSTPYTVGDIIQGELRIDHTRFWSSPETNLEKPLSFIYELETSPETWLIAGQRRAYFTATEGESLTFPVLLFPLRAGKLMLPVVEIRMAKEDETEDGITSETDYQSLGTAIEVVPGVTGVSLDVVTSSSGGLDGEVKVLEVERDDRVMA